MDNAFPYSIKTIKINNKDWEYISEGEGNRALLIFPGGGQIAQSTFDLIETFCNSYKVIAITVYDVDTIVEFCEAVNMILEKEGVNDVILYGLSQGGMLVQSYLRRNKERAQALIISHSIAPKSASYPRRIIIPLTLLNIFLPFIPASLIKYVAQRLSGKIQGVTNENHKKLLPQMDRRKEELSNFFTKEFITKYLTKRLLMTWINLHFDFYHNEKFTPNDLSDWKGKVLILRTDNDPLAQDDGEFAKLYKEARVYTFHGTGHLTFYYQSEKIIEVIKNFLE